MADKIYDDNNDPNKSNPKRGGGDFYDRLHAAQDAQGERLDRINEQIKQSKEVDDSLAKIRRDNPVGSADGLDKAEREAGKQSQSEGEGNDKKSHSPLGLKDSEDAASWLTAGMGNRSKELPLGQRIKNIPKRRKAFAMLGVGGVVGLILAIFTIGPIFRVPSLMSGLLDKVSDKVLDVAEDRAQRLIMSYLIQAAGGNPNDYVVLDSPVATLWATFQVNRLEDKIYKQTGLKIVNEDGKILLKLDHGDRELLKTQIKNYDDIVKLLDNPDLSELSKKELKKAMRTIIRTTVPVWRYAYSTKMANFMRIKYGSRFDAPHYDPSKSREQNAEAFRKRMIDSVSKQTIGRLNSIMKCITNLDCKDLQQGNKPIQTQKPPESVDQSGDEITKAAEESYPSARDEAAKVDPTKGDAGFTKKLTEKIALKLAVASTGIGTAIEAIILMTHMWELSKEINDSSLAAGGVNAVVTADATGAQFSDWQGYASNIQAGRMDIFFVSMLNDMIDGAQDAASYLYTYTGQTGNGVPVEDRVNNDLSNPALGFFKYYELSPHYHINNAIFTVIGAVLEVVGAITDFVFDLILNKILQLDEFLKGIFGENWQQELVTWAIDGVIKLLGLGIDPLATGAKLFNQIYTGGDALMNTYCRTNFGCRALSQIKSITIGNFDLPIIGGPGAMLPDERLDVAVLPLSERLFSLDEPRSLLNEGIRALPTNNNPVEWASGILRQVGTTPSQLLSLMSGHSSAVATDTTPDQDASVAGVRQYGWTTDDLKQDIAVEVRQQKNPVCPEVDQETTVSACKADSEIIGILNCAEGGPCPEYNIGRSDQPDTTFWASLQQLWSGRQSVATW